MTGADIFPLTRELAHWSAGAGEFPQVVRQEALRAFLNWYGCVLGGSVEEVSRRAGNAFSDPSGPARIIGQGVRAGRADAAFVNCVASSALAYDDTHLAIVTHLTGPVAAALMTLADMRPVNGARFLDALAVGIEVQCRLSNLMLLPPVQPNLSLYITGITGPIGAAAALARLGGHGPEATIWAIGHAATQAAGFRATRGSMAGLIVPGHAARVAVSAVDLAAAGIDCSADALESDRGFVALFTTGAVLSSATRGLGEDFELLANAYKPYPAWIVLHAAIDACMMLRSDIPAPEAIERVDLIVPPLSQRLADRRHPTSPYDAPISLQHWAAHVFCRGTAGAETLQQPQIDDPAIVSMRERVEIKTDASLARDAAMARVVLRDGRELHCRIDHASGSLTNPMSDDQLDAKFLAQAERVSSRAEADALLHRLRHLDRAADVAAALAG